MKRFHIYAVVPDLAAGTKFYTQLFGQPPAKQRDDYAKWMLDDPAVNFAISSRGGSVGLDHIGIQVDSSEDLAAIRALAEAAPAGDVLEQGEATCCYASSEKHWTVDPAGLVWEHFHTMAEAEAFGDVAATGHDACCIPLRAAEEGACCIPHEQSTCCG
ncbi:MAG: VOC family protein [Alphaproteobacteria bacterium]